MSAPTHRLTRTTSHLVCAVLLTLSVLIALAPAPATAAEPGLVVVDDSAVPEVLDAQLTDPVATSVFSATSEQGADALSASAIGLPAGVTVSAKNTTSATAASWTIGGTPTEDGDYPVRVTVSDGVASDFFDVTVEVVEEDATVVYTGPTSVVGPDWEADEVSVTMTAQVTQAADGFPGPIATATVDFTNTLFDDDPELCVDAPVNAGGTATCTFLADLSEFDRVDYTVQLTVGGAYRGVSASDATVTVSLPDEPDVAPPNTTITSGPSGWLLADNATFGFATSRPDSDTDFFCRFDNAKEPCQGSSVTVTNLSQRTHTFTVAAEDEDGNRDETPATREFAVPVDDAGLKPTGTWKRKSNAASYLGTFSQAKTKGVALTYQVSKVRELALLVRTGKNFGSVKVYLDDTLLKTVKTAGKAGSRMITIGQFAAARSGTVKIVTTRAKTVRIDGLGVSTAAF